MEQKSLESLSKNLKKKFNINKGDLSLIVGGPPCQGYSGIGHRRSYKVDKEKYLQITYIKKCIK